MDSTNWSDEQKAIAGSRFASRLNKLLKGAAFMAASRRNKVAIDLSIAVAESGLTRQAVADNAGMKLSQLSRQLSGDTNLTLDSIAKICSAVNYDFDVVLRRQGTKPALQPWQQTLTRATVLRLISNSDSSEKMTHAWGQSKPVSNVSVNDSKFHSESPFDEFGYEAVG